METIQLLLSFAGWTIFIYFGIFALYFLLFAVASLFYRETPTTTINKRSKYAIFIPAYKEDNVIVKVAKDASNHKSKNCTFDLFVIADTLREETLKTLKDMPLILIEVSFEVSKKSKALNTAMASIDTKYDYALILDADNSMEPGFLDRIDAVMNRGFMVVQGHRKDKNHNTPYAVLDAISEAVNNAIFRKGHRVLGLSAALIGSGFAVKYDHFKRLMKLVDSVGEDKEMEIKLLKEKIKIGFANKAVVLDEKTQRAEAFLNQRRRWLSAQFSCFLKYFLVACRDLLLHKNIDLFDKAIQMISPPRVLMLGFTVMISALSFLLSLTIAKELPVYASYTQWLFLFIISFIAVIISVPRKFYTAQNLYALIQLPKVFWLMLLALFRLKGAGKKFIHTPHGEI